MMICTEMSFIFGLVNPGHSIPSSIPHQAGTSKSRRKRSDPRHPDQDRFWQGFSQCIGRGPSSTRSKSLAWLFHHKRSDGFLASMRQLKCHKPPGFRLQCSELRLASGFRQGPKIDTSLPWFQLVPISGYRSCTLRSLKRDQSHWFSSRTPPAEHIACKDLQRMKALMSHSHFEQRYSIWKANSIVHARVVVFIWIITSVVVVGIDWEKASIIYGTRWDTACN